MRRSVLRALFDEEAGISGDGASPGVSELRSDGARSGEKRRLRAQCGVTGWNYVRMFSSWAACAEEVLNVR